MTSNMQQMELGYDQVQDRLVFSISTQDLSEYRFWITRRATKMLWSVLMQLLKSDQKDQLRQTQISRRIAQQIRQEKEQRNPTASQYSSSGTAKPLGEEPLLLFGVRAKPATEDSPAITLQLEDNQNHSLQIGGDSTIILALSQLIRECEQLAEWNLDLTVPQDPHSSDYSSSSSSSKSKKNKKREEEVEEIEG